MFLIGKLRPTGLFTWLRRSTRGSRFAVSQPEFKAAFQREKALAIRNLRSFSLVVFQPSDPKSSRATDLLPILEERVRCYDTVGCLGAERLAALLPETDEQGTEALVDAILRQAAEIGVDFGYRIHSYPIVEEVSDSGPDDPVDSAADDGDELDDDFTQGGEASRSGGQAATRTGGGVALLERESAVRTQPDTTAGPLPTAEELEAPTEAEEEEAQREPDLQKEHACKEKAFALDIGPLETTEVSLLRRLLDIAVSGTALMLLAPLFLVVGILVKVTSKGPIIFKQQRAGQGGKPFWFFKFRSMRVDAEKIREQLAESNEKDGPIFKIKNDPRMTPIGRFLRKTSIDELPQLWNVLRGDMTLVGPRPPMLNEVAEYEPWQRERLNVKGGLTCVWQVSGRSEIGFEEWVRMDLRYAQRRSMSLDLMLLLRTAEAVVSGKGAY